MKISEAGLNLIKQFEGCSLTAYKDAVGILTIGYGHTKGVKSGQKITQAQADAFLLEDIAAAEKAVNSYKYSYNINQYSALVSFTFNCGAGNLKTITNNGARTLEQISARIPNYNKAGGKVLLGLVRRREVEKKLFDTPTNEILEIESPYFDKYTGASKSLVDALKSIGADSSLASRKKIAAKNNISNYKGTAPQNMKLLEILKRGELLKP